jgi:hypothetical protein
MRFFGIQIGLLQVAFQSLMPQFSTAALQLPEEKT